MADPFDPALEGTRGAFAFAAAEMSHDELRSVGKLLSELEASEGWKTLLGMVERRREVALAGVVHADPRTTAHQQYAAVGGQVEALDWVRLAPEAFRSFLRDKDDEERRALESTQGASERS